MEGQPFPRILASYEALFVDFKPCSLKNISLVLFVMMCLVTLPFPAECRVDGRMAELAEKRCLLSLGLH